MVSYLLELGRLFLERIKRIRLVIRHLEIVICWNLRMSSRKESSFFVSNGVGTIHASSFGLGRDSP